MKVFVENEAGSNQKNLYNEKTLEYRKTVTVSREYPYPYGFILNTTGGDGDNLDCFVITNKRLKGGDTVEAEPIGLMEQEENGKTDNNVLAILPEESIELTDDIKQKLTDFVNHVFDHRAHKTVTAGRFLGKDLALAEIGRSLDKMKKRSYSLEPYNPRWVEQFNEIKKSLSNIFEKVALNIEHVGSTSIQGMISKPAIDVLVTVSKMEPFSNEKKRMVGMKYRWEENYIAPETLVFFKEGVGGDKTENIHVCVEGSPKAIQFITMRDYLRAHPDRAKAYGKLKVELKKKYPDDYPAYRAGKKDFLDETEQLAEAWVAKK